MAGKHWANLMMVMELFFTLVSRLDEVVLVDTTLTGKSPHENIKMRL